MKYELEEWIRLVLQSLIALALICGTAFAPIVPLWADVVVRLCGAAVVFLVGFGVGVYNPKDGVNNE